MTGDTAFITDIQRSSVHDGPGFRTTVFFKGCQLHCAWCHNPETINFEPETLNYPEKCIGCGKCDEGCFSGAKVVCGKRMTTDEVLKQIELDAPYYSGGGGVTLSGGEPLCQAAFAQKLLEKCRDKGIGGAMETNLAVDWQTAQPVVNMLSLLMADLKAWDESIHMKYTGAGNRLIKENLQKTALTGVPLILRTPVVPGVNDSETEIAAIAKFAKGLPNLRYYELLAYHPLGLDKARALGRQYEQFEQPTKARMRELCDVAIKQGVNVAVNGVMADKFFGR